MCWRSDRLDDRFVWEYETPMMPILWAVTQEIKYILFYSTLNINFVSYFVPYLAVYGVSLSVKNLCVFKSARFEFRFRF